MNFQVKTSGMTVNLCYQNLTIGGNIVQVKEGIYTSPEPSEISGKNRKNLYPMFLNFGTRWDGGTDFCFKTINIEHQQNVQY